MTLLNYALKPTKLRTIKFILLIRLLDFYRLANNQFDEETLNELLDYLASPGIIILTT